MARVYVSAVMNATLGEAWSFLRDFGALGRYQQVTPPSTSRIWPVM